MKKFLPLIVFVLVSCATQFQPIGNEIVYQPPKGWEVSENHPENPFSDSFFDGLDKEYIVYLNGLNQIAVGVVYLNKPFNYDRALIEAKQKTQNIEPDPLNNKTALSYEIENIVSQDDVFMAMNGYGLHYKTPDGLSAIMLIGYVGFSGESGQDALSDISSYRNTIRSIQFK